jgi:hypothetical protein
LVHDDTGEGDTNMALTDRKIKAATHRRSIVKLSDGGGLQLWITPDGAKRWRLAYRHSGKQKTLALGVYPTMGLKEARTAKDTAKRLIAAGQDPVIARRLERAAKVTAAANTFAALADELLEKKRREAKAERTTAKIEWLLGLARSDLADRPISEITAPEILRVLKVVEAPGTAGDGEAATSHHRSSFPLCSGDRARGCRPDWIP